MSPEKNGTRGEITSNQKAEALRRVILHKESITEIAHEYGVHRNTITNWKETLLQNAHRAFEQSDKDSTEKGAIKPQAESEKYDECIEFLRSEIAELKKKARIG
tara:strand:- start:102 stop:413 length:312 start_codon:yes stop_codon:yes gene_type:complete